MLTKYPNFLLVGAAKSGTTSLYYYLNQHPDIFMSPVKEPQFFSSYGVVDKMLEKEFSHHSDVPLSASASALASSMEEIVNDPEDYSKLYSDAVHEKAIGEATVYYLPDHEKTISNIKKLVPDWKKLKIMIILRNPVEASFSKYQMYNLYCKYVLKSKNTPSFEESFKQEDVIIRNGNRFLSHFRWFLYYKQVKDYLDNFENVKIFLYSDLKQDVQGVLREVFDYLCVDSTYTPSLAGQKYNVSGIPKSGAFFRFLVTSSPIKTFLKPLVYFFISRERKEKIVNSLLSKGMARPVMSQEMRETLKEFYHDDIVKLQDLIDRDLTDWLK